MNETNPMTKIEKVFTLEKVIFAAGGTQALPSEYSNSRISLLKIKILEKSEKLTNEEIAEIEAAHQMLITVFNAIAAELLAN
ncbi:hypothetical protein KKI22_04260 [Patescibacteria group bacterium]|nr:hypothetical protein [Patescibacteria group bacterium]